MEQNIMKVKLEKMKRLFRLYKINYESKIEDDRYTFYASTENKLKFELVDNVNYHIAVNAISYKLTLIEYLDLPALQKAYETFVENKAKELLEKYLVTLNKRERKLLENYK